jgi:hypothetical protein
MLGCRCLVSRNVEPQIGLATPGVRAMADKAMVRQDRPDIAIESHWCRGAVIGEGLAMRIARQEAQQHAPNRDVQSHHLANSRVQQR